MQDLIRIAPAAAAAAEDFDDDVADEDLDYKLCTAVAYRTFPGRTAAPDLPARWTPAR